MATFVLIHGAGCDAWYWHLLVAELLHADTTRCRRPPCEDDSAGLAEYTDTVVDAIGDRTDLVCGAVDGRVHRAAGV